MSENLLQNIPWGIVSGLSTLLFLFTLRPIARILGLLDYPGGRKQHKGEIPLIGGISIYFTIAGTLFAAETIDSEIKWLLGSGGFLVFIGLLDDLLDIKAIYKLIGQVIAASIMCIGSGIYIKQIGTLPDGTVMNIGIFGIGLTIFAVVGVTNAFNFIDGIDGLAGILAIISVVSVSFIVIATGGQLVHQESLAIFRGAIGGYLLVNMAIVTRRKVFLGDAGSMLIGFVIAWVVVYYSQLPSDRAIPTSMALWVITLPIIDTLTLTIRRISKNKSPFKPERKHLHHIFQRMGLTPMQTLGIMCIIAIGLTLVGFITFSLFGDIGTIIAFSILCLIYLRTMSRIWKVSSSIRKYFKNN